MGSPLPSHSALDLGSSSRRTGFDRASVMRSVMALPGDVADWMTGRAVIPSGDPCDADAAVRVVRASRQRAGMLTLEPDVHLFQSEAGLLGYGVWRRTAFVVGGVHPAPGQDESGVLRAFRSSLAAGGFRQVLVFPISKESRATLADIGWESMLVGGEAIVDTSLFQLTGGARENLRQMCNRARRNGISVREVQVETSEAELGPAYQRWLRARPRGYRMALVLGTPGFGRSDGRRFFGAFRGESPWGEAVVTVHPVAGGVGASVDVFARDPNARPGAVDLLLVETIRQLGAEGVEWVSLGTCPLFEPAIPDAGEEPDRIRANLLRKIWRSRWGNTLFGFQGLQRFKAKFATRWEPVYLGGAPKVGIRALYQGARMWGLLGRPRLRRVPEASEARLS